MWRKKINQFDSTKFEFPILGWVTIIMCVFLVILKIPDVGSAMARNIGAIYLLDEQSIVGRTNAEYWLKRSSRLSRDANTQRLLGKVRQFNGDIKGAMNDWQDAGLLTFAINTSFQELMSANDTEALIWTATIQEVISTPIEWERFGMVLESRGENIQAIDAYQTALDQLEVDKTHNFQVSKSEIYYRLAHIYEDQFTDLSKAIEAYSTAVIRDDFQNNWHNVESYEKLAILLINKEPEQAVNYAQQAVILMPDHSLAHSILGLSIYSATGDFNRAEQEIREAIKLDPQNAWPWMHLGQLYLQAKEYQLAVEAYLEAKKLNPEIHEADEMVTYIYKTYLENESEK